jgi:hypothetical protein
MTRFFLAGCPILRILCEGWAFAPLHQTWVTDLAPGAPGLLFGLPQTYAESTADFAITTQQNYHLQAHVSPSRIPYFCAPVCSRSHLSRSRLARACARHSRAAMAARLVRWHRSLVRGTSAASAPLARLSLRRSDPALALFSWNPRLAGLAFPRPRRLDLARRAPGHAGHARDTHLGFVQPQTCTKLG